MKRIFLETANDDHSIMSTNKPRGLSEYTRRVLKR